MKRRSHLQQCNLHLHEGKKKKHVGIKHNSQEPVTCSWLDENSQLVVKDANTTSLGGMIGEADPLQQSKMANVSL